MRRGSIPPQLSTAQLWAFALIGVGLLVLAFVLTAKPAITAQRTPAGQPTSAAFMASDSGTTTPDGAVRTFYYLLGRREYQDLRWLLTGHMLDTMPVDPAILRERAAPGELTVQQADVLDLNSPQTQATVAVEVVEHLNGGGVRRYVGTWSLIRGPAGWMLDQPNIRIE